MTVILKPPTSSSSNDQDVKTESNALAKLQTYYASLESRIGYKLFLDNTRHFGYYDSENEQPWRIKSALRRMEGELLKALDLPARSEVLDAGCGVGHVAMYMARNGGLSVHGIDVVTRHLRKAFRNVLEAGLDRQIRVLRGDYHHLDAIFEPEQFDGLYTSETLVHANDPRKVLRQFLRVLKPGGHLALHEYEHIDYAETTATAELRRAGKMMATVNKYASMPANDEFSLGVIKSIVEEVGFVDVEARDISRHIWPMLWMFYIVAWIPYMVIRLLGLERYFVNTVAGYWSWRGRETWRYIQITARKPSQKEAID